jgi:hypothetical protein
VDGLERVYCIAVASRRPEAITTARAVFSAVDAKGIAPLSRRFVDTPVEVVMSGGSLKLIHHEPLPLWGEIDDEGAFHTNPNSLAGAEDMWLCRKCGWRFSLPEAVEEAVRKIHEGQMSIDIDSLVEINLDDLYLIVHALDLELPNMPARLFTLQGESQKRGFDWLAGITRARLGVLLDWSPETLSARPDSHEVLDILEQMGSFYFDMKIYKGAVDFFQKLALCAQEGTELQRRAFHWLGRSTVELSKG